MKYAIKPILVLFLSAIYYTLIITVFLIQLVWSFDFRKAITDGNIVWYAQPLWDRDGEKYWYYRTPFDAIYGRKKWGTRHYNSFF